ncbi:barstar family protein [Streptomyces sp. PSKA54]|uniref:Barstar family protein n=1 Tax=Streptomyces himalayensis subsp. aureolus TaxID=2758039 RepID=A0A7W2D8I9_9ACTN|nr:barstar family protein [Streptomyces himalayensis]MBA4866440.1 barstar family protein [Streptomyces himalayensis subsp. aureolus]
MQLPKYALAAYDAEEPEHDQIWALCADADDLFADPPPSERVRFELLGCAPEGRLAAALAAARAEGSAPLGLLALEILDKAGNRIDEWCLEDVRIVGDRPCARELSLRDISVEAREADSRRDHPGRPPLSPGYLLLGGRDEPYGRCRDLAHVGEPYAEPRPEPPLRLLGCSPRGALRTALDAGDEELGHAQILRLDALGRALQYAVEGEITAWIPSAHGRGLVDLTLEPWSQRPPYAARAVWDLWWDGVPAEPNLWARCDTASRDFWLGTALTNRDGRIPDAAPGAAYHLDGRHITDEPGFYCALGEAVNGPGGYFGRSLAAFDDCLCGGFGARWPFTVVWHDAHVARTCLGVTPHADGRPPAFEELLDHLAGKGIEVVLA